MAAYAVFQIVAVALAVSIEKMVDYEGERVLVAEKAGRRGGGGRGYFVDVCMVFFRAFLFLCVCAGARNGWHGMAWRHVKHLCLDRVEAEVVECGGDALCCCVAPPTVRDKGHRNRGPTVKHVFPRYSTCGRTLLQR